jgi:hypothetical protein
MKLATIAELRQKMRQNNIDQRIIARAAGVGTLRGAMSGAVLPDGTVLSAKCPRLEQARFRGIEATTPPELDVLFSAGFGHEEYLKSFFGGAGFDVIDVKGQEPVPVTFFHTTVSPPSPHVLREVATISEVHGVSWRGTPDFMVWDGVKWHGVEAKSQVSNWGTIKSIRAGWPQRKHILQCANYMSVMGFDEWLLAVGHYFIAEADGEKYKPEVRWYRVYLTMVDGHERFAAENEAGESIILDFDRVSVLSYLKLLLESESKNVLAPRPKWKELFPSMKGYDECNYCPMSNECNRADVGKLGYADWLERLKQKTK